VYQGDVGVAAEFLAEVFFDQRICSPLRDEAQRNNSQNATLCTKHGAAGETLMPR
jgi:hypothetical protein